MITTYCIIGKVDDIVRSYNTSNDVVCFFFGRRVRDYIVVKSDDTGNRCINFVGEFEYSKLLNQLENG